MTEICYRVWNVVWESEWHPDDKAGGRYSDSYVIDVPLDYDDVEQYITERLSNHTGYCIETFEYAVLDSEGDVLKGTSVKNFSD